ncbi:hypothetical protein B4U80_01150 [Leptotrombidium deliense]|uniref:ATP-dependent DNA helicase n=1 Tax=Leptotrombidium deliense TaxID=299467 RepID=A0A443SJ77_9ACAR|nr:hypothetical protein B4U80_01150 [Leptotrombidium deliense]
MNSNSNSKRLQEAKEELETVVKQIRDLKKRKGELEDEIWRLEDVLNAASHGMEQEFDNDSYPWSGDLKKKLKEVFKIDDFRVLQRACINATLSKIDCLLILPTGGGKSLCFQLPAVISKGITLVVSPLVSLMEDQCQGLSELNISCAMFCGEMTREQSNEIMAKLKDTNSGLRVLYVTPEKLAKNKTLMSQLEKIYQAKRLDRIVIDEVHCCSQWGHDFRPDYKFLNVMKKQFPDSPILGLTATATPAVIVDIQKILGIEGCCVLKGTFFRPNLKYRIQYTDSKDVTEIAKLINDKYQKMCGIVYCLTTKDTEEVSSVLRRNKIKSSFYHAKMSQEDRSEVQRAWHTGNITVIVATIAFGMGINKLNVRFVIHHGLSKSIENYYQETGRAGRDGEISDCILYFRSSDVFRLTSMFFSEYSSQSNIYKMIRFCVDHNTCRKQYLAEYFEDDSQLVCDNMCDNCENRDLNKFRSINVKKYCCHLLQIIGKAKKVNERLTALKLVDIWLGKGDKRFRIPDVNPAMSRGQCELTVIYLLMDKYLKEEFHFTPYSTISYIVAGAQSSSVQQKDSIDYLFPIVDSNNGSNNCTETTKKKRASSNSSVKNSEKRKLKKISNGEDDEDIVVVE